MARPPSSSITTTAPAASSGTAGVEPPGSPAATGAAAEADWAAAGLAGAAAWLAALRTPRAASVSRRAVGAWNQPPVVAIPSMKCWPAAVKVTGPPWANGYSSCRTASSPPAGDGMVKVTR